MSIVVTAYANLVVSIAALHEAGSRTTPMRPAEGRDYSCGRWW
jgi:hypothetical protein